MKERLIKLKKYDNVLANSYILSVFVICSYICFISSYFVFEILSFFLSAPNGVEHEKKSRESKHIELRQAQNARFSPPASGAVEKKEHGRRYQNDASRRRRREEWKN